MIFWTNLEWYGCFAAVKKIIYESVRLTKIRDIPKKIVATDVSVADL